MLISTIQVNSQVRRNSSVQQSNSHLKIMGIPITGSYSSFTTQLSNKGFRKVTAGNDVYWDGKFNGEDVRISLNTTPISRNVYMVAVMYKQQLNRNQADNKCKSLMGRIGQKYNTSFAYNENKDQDLYCDYLAQISGNGRLIGIIEVNAFQDLNGYGVNVIYIDAIGVQKHNKEQSKYSNNMDNSDF